jgi:hypothetical protein
MKRQVQKVAIQTKHTKSDDTNIALCALHGKQNIYDGKLEN